MNVTMRLLGAPLVEAEGKKVNLPLRKAEALLYYLVLNGRTSREKLATLLWGDRDEEAANNNLRNSLYQLRKVLPPDSISSDRRNIYLREDIFSCDVQDLPRLTDLSFKSWPGLCCELLHGFEVSESDEFTSWLEAERRRVREEILSGLRQRIAMSYEIQDQDERKLCLRSLLEMDPYDEDSCLELMELYSDEGGLSRALDLFETFRKRIAGDLGLEPSDRAKSFLKRITAKGVARSNSVHDLKSFFFGRQAELGQILPALASGNDKCFCVNLYGEAGVGKSSLVRHILHLKGSQSPLTLWARGYEVGKETPFASWNGFFEELGSQVDLESLDLEPIKLSLLSAVFPGLFKGRRVTGTFELSSLFSDPNPTTLGQILGEILSILVEQHSVNVVMEDLQWFDSLSLHLLGGLVQTLSPKVVILATNRTAEGRKPRAFLKQLAAKGLLELFDMEVEPFSQEESYAFCGHFLSREALKAVGKSMIFRETQGVPLFLVELIKSINGQGNRNEADGLWGVIAGRCENLDDSQRFFLEVLSLFDEGASLEQLSRITGKDALALSRTAESLLDKGLVEERSSHDSYDLVVCFHHVKVREYIYQSMPQFKKKELHKKVAAYIESFYSPQAWDPQLSAQLFHHYGCAGQEEKELELHLREMRLHIILNHELFPLLRDEVLLSCSSPFSDRTDTEMRLDQVRELLHRLNRRGPSGTDLLRMEAAYLELRGGYLIAWGQYKEGRHFINRALRITEDQGFDDLSLRCLQHLCYHGVQTDNAVLIEPHAREMIQKARKMNKEHYLGAGLRFAGVARQLTGDFQGAEKIFQRSVELFEELAEVGRSYSLNLLAAWNYRGELRHWQGRLKEALDCFNCCIRRCEEEGFFWGLSLFHSNAANVAFDLRDFDLMARHVDRAVGLFERCQGGRSGSMVYSLKAISEVRRGRLEEALKALQRGELLCTPIRKKSWMSIQSLAKAFLADEMEKNDKARTLWGGVLIESSRFYAEEALHLFSELHETHRVDALKKRFRL